MAPQEGQLFAGYEVLKKLGQGGMGMVYKARDIHLDRAVALKALATDLAQDAEFIARFRREASLAAKLDHPNLVRVFAAGESEGTHYIVMELVDGESASDRLVRDGKLPPMDALAIGIFVAEALDHGWQQARLIHRDVKPGNIFLSNDSHVKLGDLGLAKVAGETSGLTTAGQAMGTPFYISPEQGLGEKELDFRSDIYNLGCTLYHLITGSPPYASSSSMAIIHKHIYDPPPGILERMPDCPMPLALLLAKMMAKQPQARHQSYTELIAEMQHVRYQLLEPVAPAPASKALSATTTLRPAPEHRSFHALTYGVLAAALISIAAGLWIWEPWHSNPTAASSTAHSRIQPQPQTRPSAPTDSLAGFVAQIAALPAPEQVQRVLARLKELHPGFDGQATSNIEGGVVTELKFTFPALTDLSPLRALPGLRRLTCGNGTQALALTDLSPLRGLLLEALDCGDSQVSDLSPLAGMPLQEFRCSTTLVQDLSPLRHAPLTKLDIYHTPVSDLSPLAECPLRWLNCKRTGVQDLSALRAMPLVELHCEPVLAAQHATLLRAIPTLKRLNGENLP